jgi:flagellar biosynthetic protein FliR
VPLADTLTALSFAFMLVLCRCAAAVSLLPGFGESEPPVMLRAGIALSFAVLLTPVVAPDLPHAPAGFLPLAGMITGEILTGALLGWLARLVALALAMCGQILSLATGHSSVLMPDSVLGAQSNALGRLLNMATPVLILGSPLYTLPIQALAASYRVLPAGGAWPAGDFADTAVRATGECFALALSLASPFLLISIVWQAGLGLLSRLAPQLQVYFVAMPGQLLGGLLLLALLAEPVLAAWSSAAQAAFAALP